MMGPRQVEQGVLFYNFSLDAHVPADHLLRSIDRFVDLSELRRELAPFYSTLGRPSIDPELISACRRRVLLRYPLRAASLRRGPPQSGVPVVLPAPARRRCPRSFHLLKEPAWPFPRERSPATRFETVLQRCIAEGLVGGEAFAIDASLIKADANRQKGIEGEKGLPPEATGRAVKEYMAVLDERPSALRPMSCQFVSPADPAARWTGAHGGQAFFAYSTNYLIDVDNGIIVDVEATTAIRQAEVLAAKRMIERSLDRFDLIRHASWGTAPMAQPRCSGGSSTSMASNHM